MVTLVPREAPFALFLLLLPCPSLAPYQSATKGRCPSRLPKREFSGGTAGGKGEERRGVRIPPRVEVSRGGRTRADVGGRGGKAELAGASF